MVSWAVNFFGRISKKRLTKISQKDILKIAKNNKEENTHGNKGILSKDRNRAQ